MKKRLLAMLLALCMVITLLPTAVFAVDTENTGNVVAKIDDVEYSSFADALAAVNDGETIVMQAAGSVTDDLYIRGKKITLDMNGQTLTFGDSVGLNIEEAAGVNVTGEGTINGGWGTFLLRGKDNGTTTTLTIDKDVTVAGKKDVIYITYYGNTTASHGTVVDIYGTVSGKQPIYVQGNTTDTSGDIPQINIHSGAKIIGDNQDPAAYLAGYAKTTIEDGATLTAGEGQNVIEIAAGELTINGGTFTADDSTGTTDSVLGSITTTTSTAIYIKQHSSLLPVKVKINDGTFTGAQPLLEEVNEAVAEDSRKPELIDIQIKGGTFTSTAANAEAVKSASKNGEASVLSITGGTYSSDPATYVADGYGVEHDEDADTYTVKPYAKWTKEPEAVEGLTFGDGLQNLVTAGVAEKGDVLYLLEGEWEDYSEEIPQMAAPDTYTVWYKAGGADYIATEPKSLTVTIARAKANISAEDVKVEQGTEFTVTATVTGNNDAPINEDVSIKYYQDANGETEIDKPTEPGTYYAVVTFEGDNHYEEATATVTITIEEKSTDPDDSKGDTEEPKDPDDSKGDTEEPKDPDDSKGDTEEPKEPEETKDPIEKFTDLDAKDTTAWYLDDVRYVLNNNIMQGHNGNIFGPKESLTRAQMVQILYNAAEKPDVSGEKSTFTDVADDIWYADAVIWAAKEGITTGNNSSKNTFGPNDKITRQDLVVMLWRYAGKPTATKTTLDEFSDAAKVASYAKDALLWAYENGIVKGYEYKGDKTLNPTGNATRAEAAAMVRRYLELG